MRQRQVLLAVDPGKTSGVAAHNWETGHKAFDELDFDATCAYVLSMAQQYGEDLFIVSESFIITPNTAKNTQAPWSLELIGFMRWVSRTHTGQDLLLQPPASAKRFSSNQRLHHMGYWTVGMKGHANDAARHLLLLEATRGWLDQKILLTLAEVA